MRDNFKSVDCCMICKYRIEWADTYGEDLDLYCDLAKTGIVAKSLPVYANNICDDFEKETENGLQD